MAERYNPQEIEKKWQARWEADKLYNAEMDPSRPKHYALTMYPYPSGDLHIGHWYAMAPSDARARYMRMRGYNVMFPMGFDAFGLPAENAAIKRKIHPYSWTMANIERMRGQLRSMGAMFDWDREVVTCDPRYYKWNQWLFLRLYEAGLAYKTFAPVDWCPNCNTSLAREQVIGEDRRCERCGTLVIKKDLDQWLFRITNYADELLDFSGLDWPERVKVMQTNWIGRSEGAEVRFTTEAGYPIVVFTTRPDTLWGATFMVLAPEHPLVEKVTTPPQQAQVAAYQEQARRMSEIERQAKDKEKTGVFTGGFAINPVNGARIPIWIADYVLMSYGTGAIMAVPAHDQRDFEFARKYGLKIQVVIQGENTPANGEEMELAFDAEGVMINSGPFNGTPSAEGIRKVTAWLEEQGIGKFAVNYRLRDWLISRQRYWGTPIPMIYCPTCGALPVPDQDLPVVLPQDAEFLPTGESPLKYHLGFRYTTCPQCGGPAERDTDTMDTFVDSSWYQYAYITPYDPERLFEPAAGDYWLPVDQYTGGVEHATMHLLYTRFFTKAMRDLGLVKYDEPMLKLFNQGIILGEDNEKMSKSRGNVVDPDDLVSRYGADVVRMFLMFLSSWNQGGPWNSRGIEGITRFLGRVWELVLEPANPTAPAGYHSDQAVRDLRRVTHQTIQRVTRDLEDFGFNTTIAALMEFSNMLGRARSTPVVETPAWQEAIESLLLLLAPLAPHLSEELWHQTGRPYSVHQQPWPQVDNAAAVEDEITLVVQINGKVRDRIQVPAGIAEQEAKERALEAPGAHKMLDGKTPRQVIYVPGKLVNIVL
ncbi:MAG: leucine--tRNA ligase [Chloroflexi bacterium]|nr:leucine--tRNA ligase [Chloroflexota bacterium]